MRLRARRGSLVTLLLLLLVAGLVAGQEGFRARDAREARALVGPAPYPVQPVAPGAVRELGVTVPAFAGNSFTRWKPSDLREVNRFEAIAHRHADVLMWFADWEHVANFDPRQADAVAARGALPEIAWEPWNSSLGLHHPQPKYRLSTIIKGRHDAYIGRWAREIAQYGQPLRLRFAQEMNGDWYPWAESANGNRHGEYVRAWRHVREIFARAGATNVEWEWCPVAGNVRRSLFPGNAWVDLVGLSGFNGGTHLFDRRWRSFKAGYGKSLDYVHYLAPTLPVTVSEVSSSEVGGDKAAWITGMFDEIAKRPYIRGLTWFNVRKETDWRIDSSPTAAKAFAEGVAAAPWAVAVPAAGASARRGSAPVRPGSTRRRR